MTATVADFVTTFSGSDTCSRVAPEMDAASPLVAAAQAGDRAAFGRLVELNEAVALRTAMAALGRREDAEDAVQDAFVLAWRRLPSFRGEASFRTWLLAIVWRRALDRRQARNRWWHRARPRGAEPLDESAVPRETDGGGPEQRAIDGEERRLIARAIAALSPKLRDALLLAASGAHTYEEIAALLGVQPGTIKWRVFEARRMVRAALEAAAGSPGGRSRRNGPARPRDEGNG